MLHVTPADVSDREAVSRLAADIHEATGNSVDLATSIRATPAMRLQRPLLQKALGSKSSSCLKPTRLCLAAAPLGCGKILRLSHTLPTARQKV